MSVVLTRFTSVENRTVLHWSDRLVAGSLLAAFFAASWYLLPFWHESPELSHGFFAPWCALGLLWQSRREGGLRLFRSRLGAAVTQWILLAAACGLAWIALLAALAQGVFHAQTAFLTGLLIALFTLSATLSLSRSHAFGIRLNGASLCAALLWCLVVPLPNGTLARFTLFLQDSITAVSLRVVHLAGVAARRDGNVIELANGLLVGVEEACSGIRSLTACLFAGVVLGGLMLRGLPRRVATIVAAGAIAVTANLIRSVILCLLAARGVEIKGFWHDATAYAVLGATALVLFGGCLVLSPKSEVTGETANTSPVRHAMATTLHLILASVVPLCVGFIAFKLKSPVTANRPPPDLNATMVLSVPGWVRRSDESIFAFSTALHTSHLRQESYFRGDTRITFYLAYWPADQSTLGSVALHTPEICLPTGGWSSLQVPREIANYPLSSPRRFAFTKDDYPEHVWFWHYFDGQLVRDLAGLYPWQLGPALLSGKVSARAPQWVIRISSNKPLETLLDEPLVQEFFARVRAAGLTDAPIPLARS